MAKGVPFVACVARRSGCLSAGSGRARRCSGESLTLSSLMLVTVVLGYCPASLARLAAANSGARVRFRRLPVRKLVFE